MISRRVFIRAFPLGLLAVPVVTGAQHSTKIPRVGLLGGGSASSNAVRNEAFRQGLRELGYVEGKNIVIDDFSPKGEPIASLHSPPN